MKKTAFFLGSFIFFLDQLTKWLVESNSELLRGYQGLPVIEGFFKLQLIHNRGIAFGLLHSVDGIWKPILLSLIAVIAVAGLIFYMFHTPERDKLAFISFGLLLGGILGNFYDRIFKGEVTDFMTLHWKDAFVWPTFNVADAAISIGVFLLLFSTFFLHGKTKTDVGALVLAAFVITQPAMGEADLILSRVEDSYKDVQSFSADFVQSFSSRGISSTERGRVLMKRPGFMKWEYVSPERKLFIADGEKTYFYLEEEKQLLVSDFVIEESNSPLLFFLGQGDIRSRFTSSLLNGEEGVFVKLIPRTPDPEIKELILEVDESVNMIRSIVVRDPVGQQNEYVLTNMHKNVHISNEQFKIKVPSDVEIIEQ
jgi:lipoprotein signal peptidase/chaperone LolA